MSCHAIQIQNERDLSPRTPTCNWSQAVLVASKTSSSVWQSEGTSHMFSRP